jgi:sulfate transport system ATP-binding protein
MTVAENVSFGLAVRGQDKGKQRQRVTDLLDLMGLTGLADRYPAQLSGGQRQRVALARALAPEPRLLLLDEPFGAVDAKVREELRRWLRRLHDEVHTTSIFVTHDQEEAFAVSDRVLIVQKGRLEQEGTPAQILDDPATEFVSRFIGEVNVFDGAVRDGRGWIGPVGTPNLDLPDGPARIVVRSYDLKLWHVADGGVGTVERVLPLGDRVRVEATLDMGSPLFAQFPRRSSLLHDVAPGSRIAVEVTHARAWPATQR